MDPPVPGLLVGGLEDAGDGHRRRGRASGLRTEDCLLDGGCAQPESEYRSDSSEVDSNEFGFHPACGAPELQASVENRFVGDKSRAGQWMDGWMDGNQKISKQPEKLRKSY